MTVIDVEKWFQYNTKNQTYPYSKANAIQIIWYQGSHSYSISEEIIRLIYLFQI